MNRLWVRLSLAFGAVAITSVVAIMFTSAFIIQSNLAEIEALRRAGQGEDRPLQAVAPSELDQTRYSRPVIVNDVIVGYVYPSSNPIQTALPRDFQVIAGLNFLTIFGTVVVAVSIIFGVVVSRTLTAPLNALAVTADAIGAGQWNHRVKVKGTVEIKSLAQSFNTMVDQLQHNEELRRNLVADVAHELRTPITALQANIYAILDDAYPMTKTEIAGLYDQIRMLSRLVKDLHELSQAESGSLPMDRKPTDFSETLAELIAPFRSVAEGKDVKLETDIPPALPQVLADEERINEVMHNLLSNALRYTPPDGTITIRVRSVNDCLRVEVHDTGEGIPAEHLPNVFERFYRADYGRSRQRGGMGLGLAIAKAIIEAHKGTISVQSSGVSGEGTTFAFEIPVIREGSPQLQPAAPPK